MKKSFALLARIYVPNGDGTVRPLSPGAIVYRFLGHDYGVVADDLAGGFKSVACTLDPNGLKTPFFTVPEDLLGPPPE